MGFKDIDRNSIFTASIGFIGVIAGSLMLAYYQNKLYKTQRFDEKIEKKELILERAYSVYAKMPEIKFWQTGVKGSVDSAKAMNWIYDLEKERNPIISKQYSDLLVVNKLIELHFGENAKETVQKIFYDYRKNWWNIPSNQLNAITDLMVEEIKKEIEEK